jgi:hypothetical protein
METKMVKTTVSKERIIMSNKDEPMDHPMRTCQRIFNVTNGIERARYPAMLRTMTKKRNTAISAGAALVDYPGRYSKYTKFWNLA